jgi:hypothetical protein
LKQFAQEYTGEAVEKLVLWMRSDNPAASTHAAAMLVDRGYGKPRQQIEHDTGPNAIDLLLSFTIAVSREAGEWISHENQHCS